MCVPASLFLTPRARSNEHTYLLGVFSFEDASHGLCIKSERRLVVAVAALKALCEVGRRRGG